MWGAPEEPPDEMEGPGPSEPRAPDTPVGVKEICEDNKSQLETFKDIMLKNKSDLKKKEEELQEYASKLSEIKSRAKRSRRSKDAASPSTETTPRSRAEGGLPEVDEDVVDDISQAKTPKAKSSLLQRKLAENRKIFERRSKEMTESKRAVEEKVEAIRQQMDQTDLTMVEAQKDPLAVTPVRPVLVTPQLISPPILYVGQDKDNKIAELSNRILELEASLIDLQDNLREKDSVIDSKTKAVTLMSADLSKKGKTTLDTLEDTKDEMRSMQENFVLLETSLRGKNDNLLEQLHERNDKVAELEETINRYEQELEEKRAAETASASFSRSTMDTLADTKDAMRSMQENFVLIETSLKDKIENLLGQLEDRETKLAEAVEKIYKLESGAGIVSPPEIPDLQYKIDRLEQSNRALQDEKYELQKSIAVLQEKIVARESSNGNGLIVEKDNRIAELENLIEELKSSNQLLEEESKAELQKQVVDLATKNEEFGSKIDELERLNNDLEIERNELRARLPDESGATKEDALVRKLTKELDDLNKSMIKLKAQHKGKLRNLQKQLESFKMVSDANAELVKLGNQVALLEEEKASAGDWQDRIADLESRVSTQTNDIQSHIEAIAILENQKLDLMQELHTVKQEISALEAENAESENLRVTAEMKVVDLEEQLESSHRSREANESSQPLGESEREELLRRIEHLTSENSDLTQKLGKLDEKPSSEAGSTESFETIHEDRNEMLKKIESLSSRNNELEEKLSKLEEAARSNVGSTESFETINDTDRSELVKKIDSLSRENSDLVAKLNKYEEKGSSDTGSTESFEKIPERSENSSKIEFLTRENNELVIKLTKLEEKIENLDVRPAQADEQPSSEESSELERKLRSLVSENNDLVIELTKAQEKLSRVAEEKDLLEKRLEDSREASDLEIARQDELRSRLEALTSENNDLIIKLVKLEEKNLQLIESTQKVSVAEADGQRTRLEESEVQSGTTVTVASLEREIEECRKLIAEQADLIDEMKTKLSEKEAELASRIERINEYEASSVSVEELRRELKESFGVIDEWKFKCAEMERKMEILEAGKVSIEEGLEILQQENRALVEQSRQKDEAASALKKELDGTIGTFENQLEAERALMVKQDEEINSLREVLKSKDEELHDKYSMLQNEMIKIDSLQEELNECRTQLRQSEATIASLNEEILRLNDSAENSKEEIAVLREELLTKADKEARNEELSRTLSDKETLVDEMRATLNEQLKENAEIRNSIDNLNAEVAKLRALLTERENEVASITEAKSLVEENLRESTLARADAEIRLESLQSNFDENSRYADGLRAELNDAYRMLELLKAKHTEDIEMQNRRLEDLIEELNGKSSELETLRSELTLKTSIIQELEAKTSELDLLRRELSEKVNSIRELEVEREKLVVQNLTEQVKIALEQRVSELELKLEESSASTQAQLQKRKILAANLKKKSSEAAELETKAVQLELRLAELDTRLVESETRISHLEPKCLEAEARATSLEEKWTLEKSEKESANLRIQEIETIIQDRDSAILQLEAQLQRSRDETASATSRVDALLNDLESSSEKMNILTEQVAEMGEEIERLRTALDLGSTELESVKLDRERLIAEGESSRLKIAQEESQRQQVLEEAKEKARELGVRMQVMEAEYVEQLNTIQTLRTENGMLLSKQAQISERLENSEKEAADQRVLLEQFERESETRATESQSEAPSAVDDVPEVEGKASSSQPCDQCGQCETVVQALEAKLQERDAEIENLDNELANSIGNFVHMRESLRVSDLMNQSGARNRSLEESRENSDLVFQYNSLTASNAEIRDQLNTTIQENSELREKIASLQALNAALQERIGAVEEELVEGREATTRLQAVDALRSELLERCESRERELSGARSELEVAKQRHEESMVGIRSRVEELQVENGGLTRRCDELVEARNLAESEINSLRTEVDDCRRRIQELENNEVEEHKLEKASLVCESSRQVEAASFFEKRDDGPQLFDAARLFGSPASGSEERKEIDALRKSLTERDQEILRLGGEIRSATESLEIAEADRRRLADELAFLGQSLNERNHQVDSLSAELNNVGARLSAQFDQRRESDDERMRLEREELTLRLKEAESSVENLRAVNSKIADDLERFQQENVQLFGTLDFVSSAMKNLGELDLNALSEISDPVLPTVLSVKRAEIFDALAALRNERNDFAARISMLEREIENSSDATRVQELEERVDAILRERDIKQLQVNDLTRSLEEMQESMESASSNEEIRLRNLQAALDKALSEHDALKLRLEQVTREGEERIVDNAETQSAQGQGQPSAVEASGREADAAWDDEPRLEVDEEIWSWNPEDAESNLAAAPLIPNLEIALKARIAELEDTIKDLELERDKLAEEAKNSQLRSGKLLKKLKEFKIQNESLQQQLKIQRASGGFCDLDSAIEEELKSQITNLERSLNESRDEQRKTLAERESHSKRIEVLSAANERLVEMKERQDMEVEVLQIRARDLATKLEALERRFREACNEEPEVRVARVEAPVEARSAEPLQESPSAVPIVTECLCKKYREEIDELRDEMEALAAENEQLQKLLEEQRSTRLSTESSLSAELESRAKEVEHSRLRIEELERNLQDSRNNCQSLAHECENLASIKQSHEALKLEIAEKTSHFEAEVTRMSEQIDSAARQTSALQEHLRLLMGEKEESGEKLSAMSEAMAEVTDLLNARVQEVAELRQEMQKLKADRNEALETVEGLAQNHSRELADKLSVAEAEREASVVRVRNLREEIERLNGALVESRSHRESLQSELASKEQELFGHEDQARNYAAEIERLNEVVSHTQKSSAEAIEDAMRKIREIEDREANLKRTISELNFRESETLAQMYREIGEKDGQVSALQQTVANLEQKIHEVANGGRGRDKTVEMESDDMPVCRMADDDRELRNTIDLLRAELARKEEEIEDYRYQLSESTYPSIIQALQDQVNMLYEEKARLEESLAAATENLNVERGRKDELEELLRQQSRQQSELESQVDELAGIVEGGENKDLEIRKLTVQVEEREARCEKVEAEVNAMRIELASRDEEISVLRRKLDSTSEECELLKRVSKTVVQGDEVEELRRSVASAAASRTSDEAKMEQSSNELDLALYMLHQRDVRCEELTHELMQLLEERDTLQLKLSNALRVSEELRRSLPADAHPSAESLQGIAEPEPLVEQPSPSRSVGPVEIAKEAIDSPSEEKVALAEKLSQLHNMGHRRDVRLMDDRDMRHNQQMSLLAHRDVLSTLPPEAAARIVNANYTLSRDVQSQSSVLMNWLWGKSTPKVVHM